MNYNGMNAQTAEVSRICLTVPFQAITIAALVKGHEALEKMMRKEMPNGLIAVSCKADYALVDWILCTRRLVEHFKGLGTYPDDDATTVKVKRKITVTPM